MTSDSAKPPAKTAGEILDVAEALIQTRGYSAFSYQDISDALGIRKASIHYHFRAKADLAVAVVDRYAARFSAALSEIEANPRRTSAAMLDQYLTPFLEFAKTLDKVCLCGALAGEMLALPGEVRTRVDKFFVEHQLWLARILQRGIERGEFSLSSRPLRVARLMFGALQGALLVKRTTGDTAQLTDVVAALKAQLMPESGRAVVEKRAGRTAARE